jgi:hypothetical protein
MLAGESDPPFELNETEYVAPAQRAYKVVVAVGMYGEETVVPVGVTDQPKKT